MPLLLFAAASFACNNPTHSDGDNMRCANVGETLRLHGIDAPEMPGSCRPGRACTPGDPYAARAYLESLTRGREVLCEQVDTDDYGRRVVECRADGQNIGCAMVAGGHAVERYGSPDCGTVAGPSPAPAPGPNSPDSEITIPTGNADPPLPSPDQPEPQRLPPPDWPQPPQNGPDEPAPWPDWADIKADAAYGWAWVTERLPVSGLFAAWLAVINGLGFALMATDKRRAVAAIHRRVRRIPEAMLLLVAAVGGSAGMLLARQMLRHKTLKQPFSRYLIAIAGLQIGVLAGLLWLAMQG